MMNRGTNFGCGSNVVSSHVGLSNSRNGFHGMGVVILIKEIQVRETLNHVPSSWFEDAECLEFGEYVVEL